VSRSRRAGSVDLAVVCVAALLSAALVALPLDGLLVGLLLVPLVLVLPGYALAAALFPPGTISGEERLVYVFALSVGAASLAGLLWQLAFDLEQATWVLVLVAVTLAAAAVAQRRRAISRVPSTASQLPPLPKLGAATGLALLAAVALTVLAVRSATAGLQEQRSESHFSALWAVPTDPGGLETGVSNHQGAVHRFNLLVERKGVFLRGWKGRLGATQSESFSLDQSQLSGSGPVTVSLYRDGELYRRVEIQLRGEA
jgi:hypothetical protein